MASQTKRKHCDTFNRKECDELIHFMKYHTRTSHRERFKWIRQWLETNKDDGNTLKTALSYQVFSFRETPLLKMLWWKHPPFDIIQTIIKHAPEVLKMKNKHGWLPIHVACCNQASLEVIQALLTASPDSIKAEVRDGKLPIHCACLRDDVSLDVFNLLIKSYPEGMDHEDKKGDKTLYYWKQKMYAEKKDDSGMLPLHHAANNGYSLHLIHFLIQAYPESTTFQDNDGNTPLQYLAKAASRVDERGMLLLHREAAHCSGLNAELLPILFHANPEAIRLQDKWGLLPLHHASLNKASPLEALILLVKLYPEGISV